MQAAAIEIACVAPVHPYRFLDLVYRHFYPELWSAQHRWFEASAGLMLGSRVITVEEAAGVHFSWPLYAPKALTGSKESLLTRLVVYGYRLLL